MNKLLVISTLQYNLDSFSQYFICVYCLVLNKGFLVHIVFLRLVLLR
uniref:Uncharacterized protein n=1 Tax=Arundo donax TaxID=35708 RepID=A0A0A9G2D7_ARUDO